ncbi:acVLRF1 family peptidyl-tRNA hydrolase [Salininema proteolyticum]|uniref:AcVLRF1 family peptidyl-tRNA hydrolase n=1 Tax=Salininema proteolyticum TaxID=1607685 RepID=A0ABV8U0G9_9ACTN
MARVRPAPGGGRVVEVEPERLDRWIGGFAERNGGIASRELAGDVWTLRGGDGTVAEVTWLLDPGAPVRWNADGIAVENFPLAAESELRLPRRYGILVVRKGAHSVAIVDERGRVVRSKTDSSYVQGKTKAGGQSQQRFARRRGEQAKAAQKKAVAAVRAVLGAAEFDVLVAGGPAESVLSEAGLASFRPSVHFGDVGEPKRALALELWERARSFEILVRGGVQG